MPYCGPQLRSTASRAAPPEASPGARGTGRIRSPSAGPGCCGKKATLSVSPGRPARGRTPEREEGSGSHVVEAEEVVAGEGAERGHGGGAAAAGAGPEVMAARGALPARRSGAAVRPCSAAAAEAWGLGSAFPTGLVKSGSQRELGSLRQAVQNQHQSAWGSARSAASQLP